MRIICSNIATTRATADNRWRAAQTINIADMEQRDAANLLDPTIFSITPYDYCVCFGNGTFVGRHLGRITGGARRKSDVDALLGPTPADGAITGVGV